MGLSTAHFLAKENIHVTVIEKEKLLGGLSRSTEIMPGVRWDQYYHAILSSDIEVLRLLSEVGLSNDIFFTETKTGFYSKGGLHSMSSTLEFLRFKPLNLWDKFRLGMGIIYSSKIAGGKSLERVYAKQWLIRVFGKRNYEKLWDPLLRSKFGSERSHSSASLIWATIKRYYGTRQGSSKKEKMGYVHQGYNSILRQIEVSILEKDGTFVKGREAVAIEPLRNGNVRVALQNGEFRDFDKVIATIPNPAIERLLPEMPENFRNKLRGVKYLSLVCLTILLKRPLSDFYVLNLTDTGFPFTGVIETTNLIPCSEVNDYALVYLPKYLSSDEEFFAADSKEVFTTFFDSLIKIFPALTEEDVIHWSVNREKYVQPLLDVNYSERVLPMQTPIENVYMVNTTMILNSNLNNNEVITLARKMSESILNSR